jgi:hypothetical protein
LYKGNVVANSIEALTLLLTALYSLYCGRSFELVSLCGMLSSKMSLTDGLDKEDRVSHLQILATIVLGFQILLDYSGVTIKTSGFKILQGCQHISREENLCHPELILI